jgi:hypothetical protein
LSVTLFEKKLADPTSQFPQISPDFPAKYEFLSKFTIKYQKHSPFLLKIQKTLEMTKTFSLRKVEKPKPTFLKIQITQGLKNETSLTFRTGSNIALRHLIGGDFFRSRFQLKKLNF